MLLATNAKFGFESDQGDSGRDFRADYWFTEKADNEGGRVTNCPARRIIIPR